MEENDVDELMRKVLIDALVLDWSDALKTAPILETSNKFRNQMTAMLADPFIWYRKKMSPGWKKVANTAASIIITILLGFGSLMLVSSNVRAAVIKWVMEWYETHIEYRYSGEAIQTELPQYQITELPKGYLEIDRLVYAEYISVTYCNTNGDTLYLDYAYIQEGTVSSFETNNIDVLDIYVNECPGQLFLSQDPNQSNAITWIDVAKNIQFTVNGFLDESELLNMAANISLIDYTK